MNSYHGRAGLLAVAVLLGACAPAVMVNTADEEAAVRARAAAFLAAAQAKDLDRLAGFLAPNTVAAFSNTAPVSGAAQVRATWAEFLGLPGISISWRPTTVTVASSGDLATEVGTYELAFDGPSGRVNDTGSYTTVWQKVGGEWVVVNDMAASSVPLPAAGPSTVNVSVTFDTSTAHEMLGAGAVNWQPFAVEGFPAGASMAVIHGNPAATGDYTLRLRFPNGYKVPVHWHSMAEHVTILSGVFNFAMSGDPTAATHPHGAGDFLYIPPRVPHLGTMQGETILQLHGMGPFTVNLGTP
jgi:ketosteroid isomerase-like protein